MSGAAQAVVIDAGDGSGNTTVDVPTTDNPNDIAREQAFADVFGHVGALYDSSNNSSSAVYLGDGWVISAFHNVDANFGAGGVGQVTLGGTTYDPFAGSLHRLHKPGDESTLTDLALFRIQGDPGLAPLTISSATRTNNEEVRMAGNGRDRQSGKTYWVVTEEPVDPGEPEGETEPVWTETNNQNEADHSGYKTTGSQALRWGENAISGLNQSVSGDNSSTTMAFLTTFNDSNTFDYEAQAVRHDSGGGTFAWTGSEWELAGIMFSVGGFENQPNPATTAIFGNVTAHGDLSVYAEQINGHIPEPATLALLGAGTLLLVGRRRAGRGA
ncbi:MAG: PEP-CTERM sorting domain-containing protein [Phycisphaeraceae bacterium]